MALTKDIDSIFLELERIGAIVPEIASKEEPKTEASPTVRAPVSAAATKETAPPSFADVHAKLDAVRAAISALENWYNAHTFVTSPRVSEPAAPPKAPGKTRKKRETESVQPPEPQPPVAVAQPSQLDSLREKIRNRIRGNPNAAEDDEDDVPFVGQERAMPDSSGVSSVNSLR